MTVLHVMPDVSRAFGGPTESLIGYVQAARTAGIAPAVAAPAPPEGDRGWLRAQMPETPLHPFRRVGRGAASGAPGLLLWLARHARSFDVVHVHGLFNLTSSLAARVALWRDVPLVVRPFGTLSRYTFSHRRTRLKRLYFRGLDAPNLRHAGAVHFTTAAERDEAARLPLGLGGCSHCVPPPFRADPASAEASPGGPPTVLFLSRLHPKKNIESLLTAWPQVTAAVPEARLVIAGDGEADYVQALRRQAAALDGRVSFPGFVTGAQKARCFAEATVFALPSQHENFGVVVLEALAAGRPVVISPEVQLAPFVAEHGLGRIVERSPAPLAEALVATLRDDALHTRCRTEAPRRVAEHFSPAAVGQQLRAVYERVLKK